MAAVVLSAVPCEGDEASPPPFTSLDLRYSPGLEYVNFTQVRGRLIFPNITYQRVAIFNLAETGLGAGYQIIREPGFILAVTLTGAQNSQGASRVAPGLALYAVRGRFSLSASGGYSIFLNSSAAPVIGVDPVEGIYRLDNRWSIGAATSSVVVGQPIAVSVLPLVRYDNGHGFYEIRMDNLGPGFAQEVQARWALFF